MTAGSVQSGGGVVVVVTGPTASGKSSLAIALAEPTGIVLDADDDLLYVAAQGTDRIGVLAVSGGIVDRIEQDDIV